MTPGPSPTQPRWKQGFSRRLGYYMLGISIGLILMGFMWLSRQNEARQREAARQGQSVPQVAPAPSSP